jgi:hypothetical protein
MVKSIQADGLPLKERRVELRIAADVLKLWKTDAVLESQKLSEWVRCACEEYLLKTKILREQKRQQILRAAERK